MSIHIPVITYERVRKSPMGTFALTVRVDGKSVGVIRMMAGRYFFKPRGSRTMGEFFATLAECKKSLESA